MPQFALEFEIDITNKETLAGALNGLLMEKTAWQVVLVHTVMMNKSQLQPAVPVLIATVVINSPEADMPAVEKDFAEIIN